MITREEIKRLADQYERLNPLYNATNPLVCPPNCQDKSPLPLPDSVDYLQVQKRIVPIIEYIMCSSIAVNILTSARFVIAEKVVEQWKKIDFIRKLEGSVISRSELEDNIKSVIKGFVETNIVQSTIGIVGLVSLSTLFSISSSMLKNEKFEFCFHDLFGLNIRSKDFYFPVKQIVRRLQYRCRKELEQDAIEWASLIEEEWSKSLNANNNGLESEVVDSSDIFSRDALLSIAPQLYPRFAIFAFSHYKEFVASSNFIRILNPNLSLNSSPFYFLKALLTVFHCCNGEDVTTTLNLAYSSGFFEQESDLSRFKNVELEMGYLIEVGCMCTELTTTELDEYARSKQEVLSNELKERWIAQSVELNAKAKAKGKRQRQKLESKQRILDAQTLAITLASAGSDVSTSESSISDSPSSSIQPLADLSATLSSNSFTSESTTQLSLPSEPQEDVIEEEVLVSLVADLDIESSDDENMPGLEDASDTDSD